MERGRLRHVGRPMHDMSGSVEGLPLTLMVSMIVLAITIPIIFGSFTAYDRKRVETGLVNEINILVETVQGVYISGPGNSAVIDFEAKSGSFTSISYIRIGDEPDGTYSSAVRYKLESDSEVVIVLTYPNVPMVSAQNSSFEIGEGHYSIKAECVAASCRAGGTVIQISLIH